MRYVVAFSTIFVVLGVGLVYGSLLMVPYTVREEVRVDQSRTWIDETFVLMPFKDMPFMLTGRYPNGSIFQVDVESSDFVMFTIIGYNTGKVWFERGPMKGIQTSYWTPPTVEYAVCNFVFHNPSSVAVNVTAKVAEFYLKTTEHRNVTYYRSFLEPIYGYSGIIAIIAGAALNIAGEFSFRVHSASSTKKPS